jgi:hypothetical protein
LRVHVLALLATSTLFALGSSAIAEPTASPAVSVASEGDQDAISCKSLAPPTGTRLGARRVCKTNREWEDERRQEAADLAKMQVQLAPPGGH